MEYWCQAAELNAAGDAEQACFFLRSKFHADETCNTLVDAA
jgi:hypothetical protein